MFLNQIHLVLKFELMEWIENILYNKFNWKFAVENISYFTLTSILPIANRHLNF